MTINILPTVKFKTSTCLFVIITHAINSEMNGAIAWVVSGSETKL